MSQQIRKIYLHWSATAYDWVEPGFYHTVVLGDGRVRKLAAYDTPLTDHTYRRNTDAVALSIACMGGKVWKDYPPTDAQIQSLCVEVANLAKSLGWSTLDVDQRVLTHAEAAANRDYPIAAARQVSGLDYPSSTPQDNAYQALATKLGLPHPNYGPSYWHDGWPGGWVERWDLWQLKQTDTPGTGGFVLRDRIKTLMTQASSTSTSQSSSGTKATTDTPSTANPPGVLRTNQILVNEQPIGQGLVLTDQRAYIALGNLATTYGLTLRWNGTLKYVNVMTTNLAFRPRFLADAPVIPGFPALDLFFNRPEDAQGHPIDQPSDHLRPFMQGILINNRVHVLVADFCNEFNITFKVRPDMSINLAATPSS